MPADMSQNFDQNSADNHVLDVRLGDTLDIICPHYTNRTTVPESEWEYYIIYMVDKENYNKCIINKPHQKLLIINCSRPEVINKFTILIFDVQPIPGLPDFIVGKDYYITSTSRGSKFSINNQYKGACEQNHMKIKLQVWPEVKNNITDTGGKNNNNNNNNNNHNNNNGNNNNNNNNNNQGGGGGSSSINNGGHGASGTTGRTTLRRDRTTGTTSTYHPKHITDRPDSGETSGESSKGDKNDKVLPGTDGFPDDSMVIDASDGPNLNKGTIRDEGMKDNSSCTAVVFSRVNIILVTSLVVLLTRWSTGYCVVSR